MSIAPVANTVSAWTTQDQSTGSFTAGELAPIENLTCSDSRALLGLLNNQIQLSWDRPLGVPDHVPLSYDVAWTVLGIGGSGSTVVTNESFLYTATFAALALGIRFEVRPRIGTWTADAVGYRAAFITVLGIPVRVECDTLLGIL